MKKNCPVIVGNFSSLLLPISSTAFQIEDQESSRGQNSLNGNVKAFLIGRQDFSVRCPEAIVL